MNQDYLYRGVIDDLDIRFVIADCTQAASQIILNHDCDPVAAAILANGIASTALLSALLIEDEKYTVKWKFDGVLGLVMADCNAQTHLRALISTPHLASSIQEESEIWGKEGSISLIKSSQSKILNSGVVEANFHDLSQDLAFFLSFSDQIETGIATAVNFNPDPHNPIRNCRAFMIQALPDCNLERFDKVRGKLADAHAKQLLAQDSPSDNHFEIILKYISEDLVKQPQFSLEEAPPPQFKCTCSQKAIAQVAKSLGQDELDDAFKTSNALKITCQFCNTTYEITKADLERLA